MDVGRGLGQRATQDLVQAGPVHPRTQPLGGHLVGRDRVVLQPVDGGQLGRNGEPQPGFQEVGGEDADALQLQDFGEHQANRPLPGHQHCVAAQQGEEEQRKLAQQRLTESEATVKFLDDMLAAADPSAPSR